MYRLDTFKTISTCHPLVNLVFSRYYTGMESSPIYDYVERLSELLRMDSRQAGSAHGLQPVQIEVLHYLSICNRYSDTPMGVTEYLGHTKGTVSQTLKVLEKKGFLLKRPDKDDKRVAHMKLSAKGKRLVEKSIPTPMFLSACEDLGDDEQLKISNALKRLLTTILQANQMKSFGICSSCRYNHTTDDGNYFCNLVQQALSVDDIQLICKEHEY